MYVYNIYNDITPYPRGPILYIYTHTIEFYILYILYNDMYVCVSHGVLALSLFVQGGSEAGKAEGKDSESREIHRERGERK